MAFIDHYTHLNGIVRDQLSYMQLYNTQHIQPSMRAQGPNAQCMDYHDLSKSSTAHGDTMYRCITLSARTY